MLPPAQQRGGGEFQNWTMRPALEITSLSVGAFRCRQRINGPSCTVEEQAELIQVKATSRVRGRDVPSADKGKIEAFFEYYNHQRYHENLDNVMSADTYF